MSVPSITVPTQFLTFYLAVDISKVKEVLEFTSLDQDTPNA